VYVRLDKGFGLPDRNSDFKLFKENCWIKKQNSENLVISVGTVISNYQDHIKNNDVLLILSIQQNLKNELKEVIKNYNKIIVLDESYESAGIYSIVSEAIVELSDNKIVSETSECKYVQEKWHRSKLIQEYRK
jgi:deoxyxylulose-5-phosphate synthase